MFVALCRGANRVEFTGEQAAYPVARLRVDKYFPPVGRIDGAFGDRNLVCACPPPEVFES